MPGIICRSIFLLGLLTCRESTFASSKFWQPLEPGSHAVGFRFIAETDNSRPALPPRSGPGRQIPIAIWYPAGSTSSAPMRLRDYVIASEQAVVGIAPANPETVINAFIKPILERGTAKSDLNRLLNAPLAALRDAPTAAGRFPLLLFAHASPETESVMCEYLASHGYVVAAVRSRAVNEATYKLSRENLDAMVADQVLAAARLQRESTVANGAVGVIGMSNGSIAAVALQLKNLKVGAIVSLDGGIGEDAGGTYLKERSEGDVSKFAAPILHLYTQNNPHLNLDHLRSYATSARTFVSVRGMRHGDFLAYPMFDRIVPGFSGGNPSPDAFPSFVWVNRYTINFFNAHLRKNGISKKWLAESAESHDAPAGLLTIERLESEVEMRNGVKSKHLTFIL